MNLPYFFFNLLLRYMIKINYIIISSIESSVLVSFLSLLIPFLLSPLISVLFFLSLPIHYCFELIFHLIQLIPTTTLSIFLRLLVYIHTHNYIKCYMCTQHYIKHYIFFQLIQLEHH